MIANVRAHQSTSPNYVPALRVSHHHLMWHGMVNSFYTCMHSSSGCVSSNLNFHNHSALFTASHIRCALFPSPCGGRVASASAISHLGCFWLYHIRATRNISLCITPKTQHRNIGRNIRAIQRACTASCTMLLRAFAVRHDAFWRCVERGFASASMHGWHWRSNKFTHR